MLTISNSLSFTRAPLALLFFYDNTLIRILAVILAAFTDSIDGYVARRSKSTSKFGAILDPAMDKFFVYFVLAIFLLESKLRVWQALLMVSRDVFLCLFALYLQISGRLKTYQVHAVRWGKITTALQFIVILGLVLQFTFPWYIYASFFVLGALAFFELYKFQPKIN